MNNPPSKKTEPLVPYNAADPAQVHQRERSSQLRMDQYGEGLKYIMADARGRAWMAHMLGAKLHTRVGSMKPQLIFTGNSTTFYNAALKDLGDILAAELVHHVPGSFRLMEDEANNA